MAMYTRLCKMCDRIFTTRRYHTVTCSPRCRKRRSLVAKGGLLGSRACKRDPSPLHYGCQWR